MKTHITNCSVHLKPISIPLIILFVFIGFIFTYSPVKASTTVTVTDSWTWGDLKTAIETTYKGKDVEFNINRNTILNANSLISVPSGSSVTLTCTNTSHSTLYYTDICRDINYHGTFFDVQKDATLTLKCCISGGSDNVDGALVYDGSGNRITDTSTLSTLTQKLRNGEYNYAPVNFKYYGARLITVKGSLILDNAVLKYNYNPYSTANTNTYTDGLYRYNDRMIANTYSETLDDDTQVKLLYYNLPCKYIDGTAVNVGGSAISILSDESASFVVSNSEIYGCSSDHGPGIISEIDDNAITSNISTSRLHKNVARDIGGALYISSKASNPSESDETISIEDCEFYFNRSNNAGGAVSSGYGAKILLDSCKIHDNFSGSYGGGIAANNGNSKADGNTTHALHGGTTTILNSEIYNNTAGSNGGGIGTRPTPDNPTGNILNIHNTKIYNNKAIGEYDVSSIDSANNGFGGGLAVNNYCKLTLTESAVFGNTSYGGTCKIDGVATKKPGYGGGLYITATGPDCSFVDTTFYDNVAINNGHGGAIATNRASGLSLDGCTIENNTSGYGAGVYNFGSLDIINTTISNNDAGKFGGGISTGGTVNIRENTNITSNASEQSGGGIYNSGSLKLIDGVTLNSNETKNYGAGIYSVGDLTVEGNSIIKQNSGSKYGGGIANGGTLVVKSGEISNNNADYGGGIASNGEVVNFIGGSIHDNKALEHGGGLLISDFASSCIVSGGSVYNNEAGFDGGGILFNNAGISESNTGGKLSISNCEIYGNSADEFGGGIHNNSDRTVTINDNVKIYDNAAKYGGGIHSQTGTLNVNGPTTIYENTSSGNGGGLHINFDSTVSLEKCIFKNNKATVSGGGIFNDGTLKIEPTQENGIVVRNNTADMGGGISNNGLASLNNISVYSNNARAGGGVSNSQTLNILEGANIYSNTSKGMGAGVLANGLKAVINISGGSIYSNEAGTSGGGITLLGSSILTMSDGKIYSNTAGGSGGGIYITADGDACTISGGVIGGSTIDKDGNVVSLGNKAKHGGGIYSLRTNGLNITGGEISYNEVTAQFSEKGSVSRGGGIFNDGLLNISDTTQIHNNSAIIENIDPEATEEILDINISVGGGICNSGKTVIDGATIYNNMAKHGGGVYTSEEDGVLTVNNSTIYSNTATTIGGGIYFSGTSTTKDNTVSNCELYNNTATTGGGIGSSSNGKTKIINTQIHSNTATSIGGGVFTKTNDIFEIINCSIFSNTAIDIGGGVFLSLGTGENIISGGAIYSNTAKNAGGLYNNTNLTINNIDIYENTSEELGGGVYCYTKAKTVIGDNVSIYKNSAEVSGGGIYNTGIWNESDSLTTNTGIHVYKNTAANGAGLFNQNIFLSNNATYNENTATNSGGAVFAEHKTITLNNASIYNNTASSRGGGICSSTNSTLDLNDSNIYANTSSMGAGLYFTSTSKAGTITNSRIYKNTASIGGGISSSSTVGVTLSDSKIYENTASSRGGGIYNTGLFDFVNNEIYKNSSSNLGGGINNNGKTSQFNIKSGTVHNNTSLNGGGIYIDAGTVNMTNGEIYENTAQKKGNGVYVKSNATFMMSKTAIVKYDNVVYLENSAFITVPEPFTESKDIRAYVTGANLVPGRVIAKFGDSTDDKGSEALYWDTSELAMNKQYFVVTGHILRSGDQGAAENTDAINQQDVFLSAKYNVDFDMNPSEPEPGSSITHIIGADKTIFDDLKNKKTHTVTHKYWYEPVTISDTGHAIGSDSFGDFINWNTEANGTGTKYEPDEKNVIISADINGNITVYAQWSALIDVDYNGNGATKGENWTEEKVLVKDKKTYKISDENNAFERTETVEDGATRLFGFMGWSFEKNADTREYDFGEDIDSSVLKSYIKTKEGRDRKVATVYAVWDEFPTIEAVDRWFTLGEAQNGKITLAELLSSAKAIDGDVGNITDFYDKNNETNDLIITGKEEFTIIDYGEVDFKSFTTSGNTTVTYKAVDAVGNETYKTIIVHIVDKDEQKYDETTLFTRFISSDYYKDTNGNFVAPEYGGLNEKSKWRTDTEYSSLLTSTLSNTKDVSTDKWNTVTETWYWSMKEIEQCKNFAATHGIGNIENPNALNEFYIQFGPNNEN